MLPISEKDALQKIAALLGDWLRFSKKEVRVRHDLKDERIDGRIKTRDHDFIIEFKANSGSAQISSAIQLFKNIEPSGGQSIVPLVVVPFMGEVGRKLCREAGVSWSDLSGNASISAPGLRILIEGRPNLYKSPGRPSNPFAPKSSRITRWLLQHIDQPITQRELAKKTNMDEGFTSRIISRLEDDGLVIRGKGGLIHVPDHDVLLDSWQETYGFSKHQIIKGHVSLRSSNEILKKMPGLFEQNRMPYAATGLGAAWLYTEFTGFRIVTFYLKSLPSSNLLKRLGFMEEPRGANLWIAIPKDEGVFHGAREMEGTRCVHPVQVYLDLLGHPERAKEAAKDLRSKLLNWNKDA